MISEESLTSTMKDFVKKFGVDLIGIADLASLDGIPIGLPPNERSFLSRFRYAIVIGAQLDKVSESGSETSLFLEKVAMALQSHIIEETRYTALTIHTEDEYDPDERIGLMSLKALAKGAGLGWQGRSLLIISPHYGPLHRLIAVLTDMPLEADKPIANQCGSCSLCVEECPQHALKLVQFDDHPLRREDVLDIEACLGDKGCMVCLRACPWNEKRNDSYN